MESAGKRRRSREAGHGGHENSLIANVREKLKVSILLVQTIDQSVTHNFLAVSSTNFVRTDFPSELVFVL